MVPERFERLNRVMDRRQPDLTVLMDDVHKPHNFSAVLRTCDAVGVLRAHVVPTAEFEPARHIAGGVTRYVRVKRHRSREAAMRRMRDAGFAIVAAHPDPAAPSFRDVDYTRPTALMLGNELDGLSDAALADADTVVRIPMLGAVASLNVSVAAALILYEAQRQRMDAGLYDARRVDDDEARRTLFEWAYPRIAGLCRSRGVEYPDLGPDGEIMGEVPR